MSEFIFLDGELLKYGPPMRSLLYGEGVFETFRWMNSPPVYLGAHLDRMKRGADFLKIPFPGHERLTEEIETSIESSGLEDAYVKVCLLSSGPKKFYDVPESAQVMVLLRAYEPQADELTANVASFSRNSSSPLVRVKSINYLENVIARREAKSLGFDETIFLNERGEVAEGSATNIFWVKGGKILTPAVECGLLPGIARMVVLSLAGELGLEKVEGRFGLEHVTSSQGAFLTNSLIGVAALTEVEGKKVPMNIETFKNIRQAVFKKFEWV